MLQFHPNVKRFCYNISGGDLDPHGSHFIQDNTCSECIRLGMILCLGERCLCKSCDKCWQCHNELELAKLDMSKIPHYDPSILDQPILPF